MTDYQGYYFERFIRLNGFNITEVAKMLEVNRQTLYQYFKSKNLSTKTVSKILTTFNVKEDEIFHESLSPRIEAKPVRIYPDPLDHADNPDKVINLPDGTTALKVPIVPALAYAGYMSGFADPEYYDDLDEILIGVDKEPRGTYIGFEVVGDSMICLDSIELAEESIFPGRIAIGRDLDKELWKTRLHTHNYKNWILVHRTEGILIKQISNHDVEKGIVTVHSLNPKYKDQDLKLDDMQQIFSVIQIVHRTRTRIK